MEIILTGQLYDAQEAYRIGFINHVVPLGDPMAGAKEIAHTIVGNGLLTIRAAKEAVLNGIGSPLDEGIGVETGTFGYLCRSEDWIEGQKAFLTRTKAEFKGR